MNETKPSMMCKSRNQKLCYCSGDDDIQSNFTETCGTCKTTLIPSKSNSTDNKEKSNNSESNKTEKLTEKGLFIKFLKHLQEKKKLGEKEWASLDSNEGNVIYQFTFYILNKVQNNVHNNFKKKLSILLSFQ